MRNNSIRSISDELRRNLSGGGRRIWWVLAAALALTLGAMASRVQGAAEQPSAEYRASSAVAVKTAQAVEGPIAAILSYTGDLRAGSQVIVLPKASGRIEKLLVDVGSQVKKGDTIALLDSGSLKAQVDQARANVAAAQARYANLQAGPRSEQVAQARANLDGTRAKLAGMEAGGRAEQVAQAQASLDAARAKLAAMEAGGRGEQVLQAQAALEIAWANRERVKKGATDADRQAAQSAVDSAKAQLQTAKARLETLKQWPTQTEWGQALGALDSARANLVAAQARLNDAREGPKEDVLKAAEAAVTAAKAQVAAADDLKAMMDQPEQVRYAAGATSTEKVNRQSAAAQAAYEAAEARLVLLRRSPLPVVLQQLQSAVDAARAALTAAESRVDQMKRGATREDLQQAEAGVSAAEAALSSSQVRVKQIDEGATEEDLWLVDSAVKQAEQAVALARKPYRDEDVAQALAAVVAAEQQLALTRDPFRKEDIAQVRAAVAAAEQQLALAQNPYTEHDLATARAAVQQAQAAVELAEIALGESTVVSPMDGVVAERQQSVGALVGPATPIVGIMSKDVELVLGVDESHIDRVKEGQKAEITVAAHPDVTFPAKVASIAPSADARSRTFQVKVRPERNDGKLRPGMFTQVNIVAQEKEKAILIPREAVVNRSGQTSVFVLRGDVAQMRPVKLGLARDGMVEVASGLDAGDEVVVAGQNDLRDADEVRRS